MTNKPLQIPAKVRAVAESMGRQDWLDDLPRQIDAIEQHWSIAVGEPMSGGTEAFVARVQTGDGRAAVLKIAIPGIDPARQEIRTLRAARGKGYAEMFRADEEANILLLEQLGPQLHELALPEERQMAIICATLREAWMPQPDGPPFVTGAGRADEFAAVIESDWRKAGKPCKDGTYDLALQYAQARKRAFDPAQSVLVHGDAHEWNALQAPQSPTGFKFIDPDGAFAEPAFDLAIPMREWGAEIPSGNLLERARTRCRLLSRLAGVDPQPIWEWSLLQLLWNGLLLLRVAAHAPAAVEFAMADVLASAGP